MGKIKWTEKAILDMERLRKMGKKILILITGIVTFLATKGLSLEVSPQSASGYPQETVTVSINVTGASKAINAFGMNLVYNSTCLSYEGLSDTDLTSDFVAVGAKESGPGKLRIGGYGDAPRNLPDSGTLLYLNFKIKGTSDNCQISLLEFKDDLEGATTNSAKVTIYSAEIPDTSTQDAAPPFFFDLISPNDIWVNNSSPTFSWNPSHDDGSGIAYYHLYLNGTPNKSLSPPAVSTKPSAPLFDGSYTWKVQAENGQKLTTFSNDTFTVKIDTLAPTTKLVVTPSEYVSNQIRYIKPNATLNLTTNDTSSGISSTKYRINEGGWETDTSSIIISKEGEYSIKSSSTDVAGNEGAETFTIFVDGTPPVTSDDAPSGWTSDTVTVRLEANDAGCGAAFTYYTTNGDTPTIASVEGNRIILGQDGIYKIRYFSVDKLGNAAAPGHAEVKINRFPPNFLSGYFDPQKKQLILHFSEGVREDTGAQIKINGKALTEDETISETGGGKTLIVNLKSDTVAVFIEFGEGSIRDLEGNPILDVSKHHLYLLVEKKATLKDLTIENRSDQALAFRCKDKDELSDTLSQMIEDANKKAEADPKISKMIGAAYQIEAITPDGGDYGGGLILLRIPYEEEDDDEDLRAYRLNEESSEWELIEDGEINEPDGSKNVVRVEVDHLSLFSLGIAKQAASDLTGAKVFPNPFLQGNHPVYGASKITFSGLTSNAEIKIFTIAGELVKTLRAENGEAFWYATNENEREVASGIYIYLIADSQDKKTGKIAIIR